MTFFRMVLSISLIFGMIQFTQAKDGCRTQVYLNCTQNKTLIGHVIDASNITHNNEAECRAKCFVENQCVSYNLGPVDGVIRTCELSAADHWMRPGFLASKNGFQYCPIKDPCSSNPCPSDRLCTPDFGWDTYSCDDGAWTQWDPWGICIFSLCPHVRKRNCTNPAPQNKGKKCAGSDTEETSCKIPQRQGCDSPLGMEDRTVKDEQITSSSYYDARHAPYLARLNHQPAVGSIGSWSARNKEPGEWIQVDLLKETIITKVATQGRPSSDQWLTKYALTFSNDNYIWLEGDCVKTYNANSDRDTIVTNTLETPVKARYIRLIVKGFSTHPSLRLELYGCAP